MLEQYYHIDACTGVSLFIGREGLLRVAGCSVLKTKNNLSILKKIPGLTDLKQLPEYLAGKSVLALNISGKGVLHKRVDRLEEITPAHFRQILPNGDMKEFYVQHFASGMYSFVSIIRRDEADKWLLQLEQLNLKTVMLSLGPFPVCHIVKQLNVYGGDLVFDGHIITRDHEQYWTDYQYAEASRASFPLKAGLEELHESLLLPYAAAFQVVLQSRLDAVKASAEATDLAFELLTEKRKFRLYGVLLLGFFLVILSLNAVLFSRLFSENNELEAAVSSSRQSLADLNGVDGDIRKKETLLKEFGWDKGLDKAALIDQLAAALPAELSLDEIALNPVDPAASRQEKKLRFRDGSIRVNGHSAGILAVNEWVARLKILPWVKTCTVQDFSVNTQRDTGQFTVIIQF